MPPHAWQRKLCKMSATVDTVVQQQAGDCQRVVRGACREHERAACSQVQRLDHATTLTTWRQSHQVLGARWEQQTLTTGLAQSLQRCVNCLTACMTFVC